MCQEGSGEEDLGCQKKNESVKLVSKPPAEKEFTKVTSGGAK